MPVLISFDSPCSKLIACRQVDEFRLSVQIEWLQEVSFSQALPPHQSHQLFVLVWTPPPAPPHPRTPMMRCLVLVLRSSRQAQLAQQMGLADWADGTWCLGVKSGGFGGGRGWSSRGLIQNIPLGAAQQNPRVAQVCVDLAIRGSVFWAQDLGHTHLGPQF